LLTKFLLLSIAVSRISFELAAGRLTESKEGRRKR